MPFQLIKCCYKNLLESSTVTLSAGTENASYPLYRLYDRDVGKFFKPAAATTIEIKIDQGPYNIQAADRLLIPAGHVLDRRTLDNKYSDNDSAYSPAVVQWIQSGVGLIDKSWSSITHRYWKFIVTSPAMMPMFTELFLTQTYTWEVNPVIPTGELDDIFNVENQVTSGGYDRFLIHGIKKRQRNYSVVKRGETQRASIEALNTAWAGSKPFWLCDHEGVWIYGKLTERIKLTMEGEDESGGQYSFNFNFLEVIG